MWSTQHHLVSPVLARVWPFMTLPASRCTQFPTVMKVGLSIFRRSQSRWIAKQIEQYRAIHRTASTWYMLFAAFEAQFPNGDVKGRPFTLMQYKNHYRYLERQAERGQVEERHQQKWIKPEPVHNSESTATAPRPRLRTRATAKAMAEAENGKRRAVSTTSSSDDESLNWPRELRRSKRQRTARTTFQDDTAGTIKREDDGYCCEQQSQVEADRNRLAMELKECQTSLKRMKQSAHAWKVKYDELVASTSSKGPSKSHNLTLTMTINVDVTQNGVSTNHQTGV